MSWAVILGDIVGSSKYPDKRNILLETLNDSFNSIYVHIDNIGNRNRIKFDIYRGDSFQGIIYRPENALKAAIFIRANFLSLPKLGLDCRIAMGIGDIDYTESQSVGLLDGEAFYSAAKGLEELKLKNNNLSIEISDTSMSNFSKELKTECILVDAIIREWKDIEAEAVKLSLIYQTQKDVAHKIGITQGAVSQRLINAKFSAVESLLERYNEIARTNFRNIDFVD
jgi:predicted DNA-binding protein (UPF0251 family)